MMITSDDHHLNSVHFAILPSFKSFQISISHFGDMVDDDDSLLFPLPSGDVSSDQRGTSTAAAGARLFSSAHFDCLRFPPVCSLFLACSH